jgi:hypothetical protein
LRHLRHPLFRPHAADFASVEVTPLTFGAAYLYVGVKR